MGPLYVLVFGTLSLVACNAGANKPLGATCGDSAECSSGLCHGGACVDPAADPDGDGLTNAIEVGLGSDLAEPDSDGDGALDPDELVGLELIDTDGDGKPDIVESSRSDADGDCVTDQYDGDDMNQTDDVAAMVQAVCPLSGICAAQVSALGAACPDGQGAVCVLSGVVGYAETELACDGRDENCDGQVDEGFAADCKLAVGEPAFTAPASAARTVGTSRFRATLVVGQPALGAGGTGRHRALVGTHPGLTPIRPPESP